MKKCSFDPRVYKGAPIGMFHCPECVEMVIAGLPHYPETLCPDCGEDYFVNETIVDGELRCKCARNVSGNKEIKPARRK